MSLHDYLNVQRVLRLLAAKWGCPVWIVKRILQQAIDQSWERALSDPQAKTLWDKFFPSGKPTPNQYVLFFGHAHEN